MMCVNDKYVLMEAPVPPGAYVPGSVGVFTVEVPDVFRTTWYMALARVEGCTATVVRTERDPRRRENLKRASFAFVDVVGGFPCVPLSRDDVVIVFGCAVAAVPTLLDVCASCSVVYVERDEADFVDLSSLCDVARHKLTRVASKGRLSSAASQIDVLRDMSGVDLTGRRVWYAGGHDWRILGELQDVAAEVHTNFAEG